MSPSRARFTIRAIMIVVALVAVVLAVAVTMSRDGFLPSSRWLLFGPALIFVVPRLLLLGWMRREREDPKVRTPPPL